MVEFAFVAVPKAAAGVCTLAINIALLRFFGPEQYGIYALCISAVLVSDSILGSAIDLGVIRQASLHRDSDPKRCLAVQATGVYLKLACVMSVTIALSLAARPLSQLFFHSRNDATLIYLSCGAILALLVLRSAQMHPQIQNRFLEYGLLELLQMVLKYGGVAALLVLGQTKPAAVLFSLTAGPMLAVFIFLIVWRRELIPFPTPTWELTRELVGFVKWFFLTFSVAALVSRVDVFLLASWSNLREVGLFSAAQTFAYIPQLLGTYLSIILSPRVMPYWREGRFLSFFRKFQSAMFAACAFLYVAALLTIKTAGPLILPRSFQASQSVILILLPGALAGLLTFPLTITFLLFVRPRFLITMDCIALPLMILLYGYAIHGYGATGAAWVTSGSFVVKALIAQVEAWRLARTRQRSAELEFSLNNEAAGVLTS